jgi:hypothetical protein
MCGMAGVSGHASSGAWGTPVDVAAATAQCVWRPGVRVRCLVDAEKPLIGDNSACRRRYRVPANSVHPA